MTPDGKNSVSSVARVLHLSVNPQTSEVDLWIRIARTSLADRHGLREAMKRGEQVLLVHEPAEEEPPTEE